MNFKILKVLISFLLALCILDMPYGYYQFVRWAAMIVFAYLAYTSHTENATASTFLYVGLAILFQPIEKIALGREVWNIVDVVVAIYLIGSLFIRKKET